MNQSMNESINVFNSSSFLWFFIFVRLSFFSFVDMFFAVLSPTSQFPFAYINNQY